MSLIIRALEWLNASVAKAERDRREAYLATSANASELERRQRMLSRIGALSLDRW
jgi:hypothetical protein